jgi:hypothetical protein
LIRIISKSTIERIKKGLGEREMEECYRKTKTLLAAENRVYKKNFLVFFDVTIKKNWENKAENFFVHRKSSCQMRHSFTITMFYAW